MSPDAPAPVPVAQTWSGGAGTGSITFGLPLDTGVPLTPARFARGFGSSKRVAVTAVYGSTTRIDLTVEEIPNAPGLPVGWNYDGGVGGPVGANGTPVAAFAGYTG